MSRVVLATALIASSLLVPSVAIAASDVDLAEIREQIRQMKETYEARIRALEDRLKAAESAASAPSAQATPPASPSPATPPVAAAPGTTSGGVAPSTAAAFNPAISVVLQGNYQYLKQDPSLYGFNRIQLGDDVSPGRRGLGLGESEVNFFASVDHLFAGSLTVALAPDNSVELEEAYGVATAVPYGIVPKFGRYFSGIGYLNEHCLLYTSPSPRDS